MSSLPSMVLVVVAGGAKIGVAYFVWNRCRARKFKTRPALPPEEVLKPLGEGPASALEVLWRRLERTMGIPTGKLRLTDRFELVGSGRFLEGDVINDLRRWFRNEELQIQTLEDYCRYALQVLELASSPRDLALKILR